MLLKIVFAYILCDGCLLSMLGMLGIARDEINLGGFNPRNARLIYVLKLMNLIPHIKK